MRVSDVMTTNVITIRAAASFVEAVGLLTANDISGLPVVDANGVVVGIVTEADLISKEAYARARRRRLLGLLSKGSKAAGGWIEKASGMSVSELMTRAVISVSPAEDVRCAARLMLERGIKRLPVIDGGRLVGIVSRHDVLAVFTRSDEELRKTVLTLLERMQYVRPWHDVHVSVREGMVTLEGAVLYASDVNAVQAVVAVVDGVIGVIGRLTYREDDPRPERFANML